MQDSSTVGDYLITEQSILGEGSYSRVYLGVSQSGDSAVIKKVKKYAKNKQAYKMAQRQAVILSKMNSPFISQYIGTFQQQNYFSIIQKYDQGKSLDRMLKQRKRIVWLQAFKILQGVLGGIQYMLSKGFMHRDIKPSNIYLLKKGGTKLLDLGFACKIDKEDKFVLSQRVGTIPYMSPQMLRGEKYNSKSDIWALGVLLCQMIYGNLPFPGSRDSQVLQRINEGTTLPGELIVPGEVKWLINGCLQVQVGARMGWKALFEWRKHKCVIEMEGEEIDACWC